MNECPICGGRLRKLPFGESSVRGLSSQPLYCYHCPNCRNQSQEYYYFVVLDGWVYGFKGHWIKILKVVDTKEKVMFT